MIDHPPCSAPFWLDVLKTLIGVLVGGVLAYVVNSRLQRTEQWRKNLAAGNLAIATLSREYGDFIIARSGLRAEQDQKTQLPDWLRLDPTFMEFSEDDRIDFASLAFLFEAEHHSVYEQLAQAESKYREFGNLLKQHTVAAAERARALSSLGFKFLDGGALAQAEDILDHSLRMKLIALYNSLNHRIRRDGNQYRTAGTALYEVMVERFGEKQVIKFKPMGARAGLAERDEEEQAVEIAEPVIPAHVEARL